MIDQVIESKDTILIKIFVSHVLDRPLKNIIIYKNINRLTYLHTTTIYYLSIHWLNCSNSIRLSTKVKVSIFSIEHSKSIHTFRMWQNHNLVIDHFLTVFQHHILDQMPMYRWKKYINKQKKTILKHTENIFSSSIVDQ